MGLFSRFNQQGSTFHSSGIVGDDSTMGATNAQSFEQRRQIEHNRQRINGYKHAGVLHNYRNNARPAVMPRPASENSTAPRPSVTAPPRQSFKESQVRRYNPYS